MPLLLCASVGFEALFLRHGISTLDEAWVLYAARLLREGGVLYQDVFFVFPPGHLFPAWLALAFDPPGILFARCIYAAFQVAACLGVYLLGRRVMPAPWALLGGLLLAIGAPGSHLAQLLFGYRYLALAMLALLAFARRLDTGSSRWTFAAGVALGVCLVFRLSPALATGAAIAVGIVASERQPSRWLRDLSALAAGAAVVALPALALLLLHAGPEAVVREALMRPLLMTDVQSLPIPGIALPAEWTRDAIRGWFVGVQYRGYAALYAVYVCIVGWQWVGALRRGERFERPFLLTLVAWGALFFVRTLGRADEAHLDSALPPSCLLMAHAASQLRRVPVPRPGPARVAAGTAAGASFIVLFGFLAGSDHQALRAQRDGHPLASTGGAITSTNVFIGRALDWGASEIRRRTRPDETVLDLSATPVFWVLSDRRGPGRRDIVMPGTFSDATEERAFVEWLESRPPALVIASRVPFDLREDRDVRRVAPLLSAWVEANYEEVARRDRFVLREPRARAGER